MSEKLTMWTDHITPKINAGCSCCVSMAKHISSIQSDNDRLKLSLVEQQMNFFKREDCLERKAADNIRQKVFEHAAENEVLIDAAKNSRNRIKELGDLVINLRRSLAEEERASKAKLEWALQLESELKIMRSSRASYMGRSRALAREIKKIKEEIARNTAPKTGGDFQNDAAQTKSSSTWAVIVE